MQNKLCRDSLIQRGPPLMMALGGKADPQKEIEEKVR